MYAFVGRRSTRRHIGFFLHARNQILQTFSGQTTRINRILHAFVGPRVFSSALRVLFIHKKYKGNTILYAFVGCRSTRRHIRFFLYVRNQVLYSLVGHKTEEIKCCMVLSVVGILVGTSGSFSRKKSYSVNAYRVHPESLSFVGTSAFVYTYEIKFFTVLSGTRQKKSNAVWFCRSWVFSSAHQVFFT